MKNYTTLDICHLTANTLGGSDSHWSKGESAESSIRKMLLKQKTNWNFDLQYSSWVKNTSAGGPYAIADPQVNCSLIIYQILDSNTIFLQFKLLNRHTVEGFGIARNFLRGLKIILINISLILVHSLN